MKPWVKQFSIFTAAFLSQVTVTALAPFYSNIAYNQGISEWLIGIIYSSCPVVSLVSSFFIPTLMPKFGRSYMLISGLVFIFISKLSIALLPFCSTLTAIILSFLSQASEGIGAALGLITSYSILTSEYPENISRIVAISEIIAGLGLVIGPSLGSVFFVFLGFTYTCVALSALILAYLPILYYAIGESRTYNTSDEPVNMISVLSKPKIFLDFGMQVMIMFAIGFILPTTEFHLLDYGVKEKNVGFWFSIDTLAYFLSSIAVSMIPAHVQKPRLMVFGCFVMFFGFMFIGPTPLIFNPSLALTGLGLFLVGTAAGFIYVPSVPHMIESAQNDYGYANDDRLNDSISGLTSISLCIGEISGPIVAALLYETYGYSYSATIVAFGFILYSSVYMWFGNFDKKKQTDKALISELVEFDP